MVERNGRRRNGRRNGAHAAPAVPEAPRERPPYATAPQRERALLVGVELARGEPVFSIQESLNELGLLAESAGFEVVGAVSQRLNAPHPAHYVGAGKLEEVRQLIAELGVEAVLFDDELSPSQGRALEKALNIPVVDRTQLILAIFAQRARTREGALQVQLAQHEYLLPRIRGRWTHLERQVGGIGSRGGAGETQIESDRRLIRRRIDEFRRDLEKVRHQRGLYRERRRRAAIPTVALVGYTNAGKSTLFNRLTSAAVLADDNLFATLDPVTRRVELPSGQEALFTDTVGFIQKLPTDLVAAFRATLEELEDAALLLHVVDITHPHALEQAETVRRVVAELGVGDRPVVTALNKVDLLAAEGEDPSSPPANCPPTRDAADAEAHRSVDARQWPEPEAGADGAVASAGAAAGEGNDDRGDEATESLPDVVSALREIGSVFPHAVPVSARTGEGIEALLAEIERALAESYVDITRVIPYDRLDLLSVVRARGAVESERHLEAGTEVSARLPVGTARWLERQLSPAPAATADVPADT